MSRNPSQRDTQQEYSKNESCRHTFIARNSNPGQSERAFTLKSNGQSTLCSSFLEKEMSQMQGIKTN
jgi:hypothetical protein